ncbi:SCO7613 C-terminal domain-containing membrane protein [Streptacidiphilus jiangxiensis]|nr:autoantigen p27 domain-containing protein [Streptacidiphilus jiangxiensis]
MTGFSPPCPDCGAPLVRGGRTRCAQCGLPLVGPDAAALWQVTVALQALDHQRSTLVGQREWLLGQLRARRDAPDTPSADAPGPAVPGPGFQPGPTWAAPVREVSGRSAQAVLLVLGGLLVSLAALVFTVVSWGAMSLAARTAILLGLTACALSLPVVLRRRQMSATAEASAAVGWGLVLLDFLGARAAGLGGLRTVNAFGYWAAAVALVSVLAMAHGWVLRLRFPLAAGFLLTRLPALLFVAASGSERIAAYAAALVSATVCDSALLWRAHAHGATSPGKETRERFGGPAVYQAAAAFAVAWAVIGGAVSAGASLKAEHLADATWAAVPLGVLGLLGVLVARRYPGVPLFGRQVAAGGAAAALLSAAGGFLHVVLPAPAWTPVAYAVPAAALAVAAAAVLRSRQAAGPDPLAVGAGCSGGAVLLLGSLVVVPEILRAALEPMGQLPATWADGSATAWDWHVAASALTGLGLLALVLGIGAVIGVPGVSRTVLEVSAVAVGVPVLALLPVGVGLPYAVAVAMALVIAVVAAGAALLNPSRASRLPIPSRPAQLTASLLATGIALLWASADRAASIAVLAVCALLGAALAWRRSAVAPVAAACTVLALGAEAAAVATTVGLTLPGTALAVLGVGIASAPAAAGIARAARTASGGPEATTGLALTAGAVEGTGYGLVALALMLDMRHPGSLAFALAVSGVAALGVALRTDRRRTAAITSSCLFIVASWIRLTLWGVHTPEAYTVSVAAVALTIGHLHHRRDASTPSTVTYGPGLSLALLPSLLTLWTDGHWVRPLLLGLAALLAVVLGVRFRLRAPLLLGGAVLLLTGAHELAPTVLQVLGLLPRWVPLAAAGLLLLLLGARYEQRLRDARRLRAGLRRFQ